MKLNLAHYEEEVEVIKYREFCEEVLGSIFEFDSSYFSFGMSGDAMEVEIRGVADPEWVDVMLDGIGFDDSILDHGIVGVPEHGWIQITYTANSEGSSKPSKKLFVEAQAADFSKCFNIVIGLEGGYSVHSQRSGGVTNMGITKSTYEKFLGREVSNLEMQNISIPAAKKFYKEEFWDRIEGGTLDANMALVLYDTAVHSGVYRAMLLLQEFLGFEETGKIDKSIINRLRAETNTRILANSFLDHRWDYLRSLHNYPHYKRGWKNRIDHLRRLLK